MFLDITQFVCSSAEMVRAMLMLWFRRFLQWFISGRCQVNILMPNTVKYNFNISLFVGFSV